MPRRSAGRDPDRGGRLARLLRPRRTEPDSGPHADHGVWTVDRAARVLATACRQEGRELPAVHAVVVGADTIWFRLSTPDEQPPPGWHADHHGRTWYAALDRLQGATVAESVDEPYPQLVGLGYTSQGYVLLNLGRAGGIIGLEGDTRRARALAEEWARQLATNPWSRGVRVVRMGFQPEPAGTTEPDTLVETEPVFGERGAVLLLAEPPHGRQDEQIRGLAGDPGQRWSVVVVGRVTDPRWRFTVQPIGTIDTGLLDEPVLPRPWTPADGPARAEPTAAATGAGTAPPVAAAVDGPRRRTLARPWAVVALVGAACLLVAAIALVSPTITRAISDSTNQPASGATNAAAKKPTPTKHASPSPSPSPSASPSPSPSPSPTYSPSKPTHKAAPKGAPPGGTGVIRNVASDLCVNSDSNPAMTLNGQPSGGHAFTSTCDGTGTEQWREGPLLSQDSPRGSDMYRLVDAQTGYCLDGGGDGSVYTLPCLNPDQYQEWQRITLKPTAGDEVVAYRSQGTNRCLAVADQTLKTLPCPSTNPWPGTMRFFRRP